MQNRGKCEEGDLNPLRPIEIAQEFRGECCAVLRGVAQIGPLGANFSLGPAISTDSGLVGSGCVGATRSSLGQGRAPVVRR
jgi:hypothetical protein